MAGWIRLPGLFQNILRIPNRLAALLGKAWSEATIAAAQAAMLQDFTPLSDMRASAAYRMRVAQNLLRKYFLEMTGGQEQNLARRGGFVASGLGAP